MHEQNGIAGLTNRVLACLADKVLVAFPDAFKGNKDKPLPCGKRKPNGAATRCAPRSPPWPNREARLAGRERPLRVLVVGGSLGARR